MLKVFLFPWCYKHDNVILCYIRLLCIWPVVYAMNGGTEIQMVGYAGYADIHNLTPAHFNDHTNISDTKYRTIVLQNRVAEPGYYGSPAFLLENGTYQVIGFMVGSIEGKDRLVPIGNIK